MMSTLISRPFNLPALEEENPPEGRTMSKENDSVNRHYSRRDLLKTTVLAAGGATLAGLGACAKPHEMSVEMSIETEKPTHNMQLSLAAYSMRDALTSGQMDLFQFIDWCAEMDLQGTE